MQRGLVMRAKEMSTNDYNEKSMKDSIDVRLRAAEVAGKMSVLGHLNWVMNNINQLSDEDKFDIIDRVLQIAEDKEIPFNHPNLP